MARQKVTPAALARTTGQLAKPSEIPLRPLPFPYQATESQPRIRDLNDEQQKRYECDLDGVSAVLFPRPQKEEDKTSLVEQFLSGLRKLFAHDNNWTFLQPLFLTLEYCVKCQTCASACPIFQESSGLEIYRPTLRTELVSRLYRRYVKPAGTFLPNLRGASIDLSWELIARLLELSYRCTLCRRCAQVCPIGADNGLVARELRKLFSQEMGIAPKPLHEMGTVQQLQKGSSTGMTPDAFKDCVEFMESDIRQRTGVGFKWPIDKTGAEILLVHNAGEFLAWPENPEAIAIILEAAGISYTLSSDLLGYDAVNYGVWYDDVQLARVAMRHVRIAKKLGVKKIVIGECGHAHKALMVVADRLLSHEANIPRESWLTLLRQIIRSGRLRLDPARNEEVLVTLHDPCNLVRLMGIVEPQREVLRAVCPGFREMSPHGVNNYCCGGGSGFAIMPNGNFPDWRNVVAGRAKLRQVLNVFQDVIGREHKKYVCAPCSNCKGQFREMFAAYDVYGQCNILYGGLAELVVNAIADIKQPFLIWEWR